MLCASRAKCVRRTLSKFAPVKPNMGNKETYNQRYFSQIEAESKIGKRVQTRFEFSGVPKDSTGLVISADPAGAARVGETAQTVYDVAIQWDRQALQTALADITRRIEQADENENPIERFYKQDQLLEEQDLLLGSQPGKPLVDWFTKAEYERFLDELAEEKDSTNSHPDTL